MAAPADHDDKVSAAFTRADRTDTLKEQTYPVGHRDPVIGVNLSGKHTRFQPMQLLHDNDGGASYTFSRMMINGSEQRNNRWTLTTGEIESYVEARLETPDHPIPKALATAYSAIDFNRRHSGPKNG